MRISWNLWKRKRMTWAGFVIVLMLILTGAVFFYIDGFLNSDAIYPGIVVDGLKVGGMTQKEAMANLLENAKRRLPKKAIYLFSPSGHYRIPLDNIEYGPDYSKAIEQAWLCGRTGTIPQRLRTIYRTKTNGLHIIPELCYNKEKAGKILDSICLDQEIKPVNAGIRLEKGGFVVSPHREGIRPDRERAWLSIDQALKDGTLENIYLDMTGAIPDITTDMVDKITYRLSDFGTVFHPDNVERTHNIRTACERIHMELILPHETFSIDQAFGERTEENGYKPAKIIVNHEMVDGLGGGICQVTSTLYNAVLLSGLEVVERRNHSLSPSYVDKGRDAAISRGYIDFKFKNNSDYTILIQAAVVENQVRITLWGKEPGEKNTRRIRTRTLEIIEAEGIETETDASVKPGETELLREAIPGYLVEVYRDTYDASGKRVHTEKISVDRYLPQKKKIKVAPAAEVEEQK